MVETRETKYPGRPIVSMICLTHHGHNLTFAGVECFLAPTPRLPPPVSPAPCSLLWKEAHSYRVGRDTPPPRAVISTRIIWNSAGEIYFNRSTWIFVLQFEI